MDRYQEALERARQGKPIEEVFPELKESEDERIRKLLVWQVHRNIEDETNDLAQSVYDGIKGHDPDLEESIEDWKRCLAYLEKQKEHKTKIDACGFPLRDKGESASSYLERCLAPDMRGIWYEACAEIKGASQVHTPAGKLIAEIERTCQEMVDKGEQKGLHDAEIIRRSVISTCEDLLNFAASLQQEQPEVDLDEEFDSLLNKKEGVPRMWHSDEQIEWTKDIARHFYELGQRTKYQQDREEFAKLKAKEWQEGFDEGYAKGFNARKEAIGGVVHHALGTSWIVTNQKQLHARLKQFPEGTEVEIFIEAKKEENK